MSKEDDMHKSMCKKMDDLEEKLDCMCKKMCCIKKMWCIVFAILLLVGFAWWMKRCVKWHVKKQVAKQMSCYMGSSHNDGWYYGCSKGCSGKSDSYYSSCSAKRCHKR